MPYYNWDPKRDHNFDNHPYEPLNPGFMALRLVWGFGFRGEGLCRSFSKSETLRDPCLGPLGGSAGNVGSLLKSAYLLQRSDFRAEVWQSTLAV